MKRFSRIWFIIMLMLIFPQATAQSQQDEQLTIFAAASLSNVFTELTDLFAIQSNVDIMLNFAGSSTLAVQIQQGAATDLFASADAYQMQAVVDEGYIDASTVHGFAENELVLLLPADNPANVLQIEDIARSGILLVLAEPGVPARSYSDTLLETLAHSYGDDFPEAVYANVVSQESHVRQVAARVALGEADAGIVYRTDITPDMADSVIALEFPCGTSPRAEYVIAPLLEADNPVAAAEFLDFLQTEEGQEILEKWGFLLPIDDDLHPEITPEATEEFCE